jgi:GAF domain-containing protein
MPRKAKTRSSAGKKRPLKRTPATRAEAAEKLRAALREAERQQAATGAILRLISRSPTDLSQVMQALADNAARLCEATDAHFWLREGDYLQAVASHGRVPIRRPRLLIGRDSVTGRAVLDRKVVHVHDLAAVYKKEFPNSKVMVDSGHRTVLAVPLLRGKRSIGALLLRRTEVRPFSAKQLALLKTFADQAVIAIENVRLFNETKEALEQQTATADILKVISASPTDVQPVFDSIAEQAATLCAARFAFVTTFDGEWIHMRATHGPGAEGHRAGYPMRPGSGSIAARVVRDRAAVQVEDMLADPEYAHKEAAASEGFRSGFGVPMMRDGRIFGCIAVTRPEPGAMPARLVHLLQTFADQAVIAIENVRLFNETREALERQTATAEILRVISSSPTEIRPVLDAIAANAARLCEASDAIILLRDGDLLRFVAHYGEIPNLPRDSTRALSRELVTGRAVLEGRQIHVHDLQAETVEYPRASAIAAQFGYRTILATPLMRGGTAIGVIMVRHTENRPFGDKHLELVSTFADQAVIAIENVRLFNETTEALERQTATAEILKVIASSPTDIQPVLDAVGENAARLCEANNAVIFRLEGGLLRQVAAYGTMSTSSHPPEGLPVDRGRVTGRAVVDRRTIHVHDLAAEESEYPEGSRHARLDGHRTTLATPLLREGVPIGAILIRRLEVRPFSDKQIALLQTFADQAAIAIENVRLFNETKEALERQTATAEVLRVIASSPSDIQPVFDAIAHSANRLLGGYSTAVMRVIDDSFHLVGFTTTSAEGDAALKEGFPIRVTESGPIDSLMRQRAPVRIVDTEAVPDVPDRLRVLARARGFRSMLIVPLIREDAVIGGISVTRQKPGEFQDHDVQLLRTFADQAVIAIENVRLFNETREALERQTATAEILKVISSSPTDVRPVFDAIARSGVRLFNASMAVRLVKGDRIERVAELSPGANQITTDASAPLDEHTFSGRSIMHRELVHIPDIANAPWISDRTREIVEARGYRATVFAPMLRENEAIGAIGIFRNAPGPFDDKQIALLQTFADQAVIAIENVRLFNETKEALERQTASAAVLSAISSSIADTKPVFDKILESCERLFAGKQVGVNLVGDDGLIHLGAYHGPGREALERVFPLAVDRNSGSGRSIVEGRVMNYADTQDEREVPESTRRGCKAIGIGSVIFSPMLWQGKGMGAIFVGREHQGLFSENEVALLRTFCDQAVIAIQNARMFNDTREALETQTATAEILKVISSSPTDTQPVFDAIAGSAARLFAPRDATIMLIKDGMLHFGAWAGGPESQYGIENIKSIFPFPCDPDRGPSTRAIEERRILEILDTEAPDALAFAHTAGTALRFRSGVWVPLLKEGRGFGTLALTQPALGSPMTEKQLALLQTFADQAVIAIENARLFNETRVALERQTATAEILEVMSRSQTDLQPMFDTIATNARRLCDGDQCVVAIFDGELIHLESIRSMSPEEEQSTRQAWPRPPGRGTATARAVLTRSIVHVPDVLEDPEYELGTTARVAGWRSIVSVPMLRAGKPTGAISVTRRRPGPFADDQITLLKTFADQAVIAIENTRLFNETREALERQTATSAVLKVISGSPDDLGPVFREILEHATTLCEAQLGFVFMSGERGFDPVAQLGLDDAQFAEWSAAFALHKDPSPLSGLGRVLATKRPVLIPDVADDEAYRRRDPLRVLTVETLGARTYLAVPLLKESSVLGAVVIYRREVRPFSDKQIALLQTFADQAVIAIENVRLFNETREALERQTATAEILKVISSSPTDVTPVFDAIAERARVLCGASLGYTTRFDGERMHLVGYHGTSPQAEAVMRASFPRKPDPGSINGRCILARVPVQIADVRRDPEYQLHAEATAAEYRSMLAVPMLQGDQCIGALGVARKEPGAFPDKLIALLQTFADQALIAIENVRLFKELQQRTEALTRSVGQLTALGEVSQAISSTLDVEKVLQTIVERAVQITGLDSGAIYEYEEDRQVFHLRGARNFPEELAELLRREPPRLGEGAVGTAGMTRQPVQVPDIVELSYQSRVRNLLVEAGWRGLLVVPLLSEGRLLGALSVSRRTPGEFAPEVIELLETFATQSAIAIQNARLFREIEQKSRELEEASRHKSQFLASMSHELRTPLNAILGFNEMILGEIYGDVPPDMKEPLEDIQTSGKHLLRLINNVLDLAKIEAGRMELALADYAVQDLVESIRATLRPLAEAKGLEFLASVPADVPLAHGDFGRLTQCLMNLAGNSLKFTKAGHVSISVEPNGETLTFRVADTGMGIPPEKIGTLFTEFKQTDATIASEYGGTGLGLSITKKFIEMHGGRIWVESEPGKGSVFIFEVPHRARIA